MHWTASQTGDWDTEQNLVFIDQTPGDIHFFSTADTDLICAARHWTKFFGKRLRLAHAALLRQPVVADHYTRQVLKHSKLVVARLLGGAAYFLHLLQCFCDLREDRCCPRLLLLTGDQTIDETLLKLSDFSEKFYQQTTSCFVEGGAENFQHLAEIFDKMLEDPSQEQIPSPYLIPKWGLYKRSLQPAIRKAWICFYRASYQAGDLATIDSLFENLEKRGFETAAFFSHSLRDPEIQAQLIAEAKNVSPDVVLTTQNFSISSKQSDQPILFQQLNCPILQASLSIHDRATWMTHRMGITPTEIAMNIALPELDGRIFTTHIGFKENQKLVSEAEWTIKQLLPDPAQIQFVTDLAAHWAELRQISNSQKRIAIILSNYPNRNGRIGNGVGLDTPASLIALLRALRQQGYVCHEFPEQSDAFMQLLQQSMTHDEEESYDKPISQSYSAERLKNFLQTLPQKRRDEMELHWSEKKYWPETFAVPGLNLGNIFVGIQPPRGFSLQTQAIYHSPDLPPPPGYLAFYLWIREAFQANAIIHLGKHGNLEWLPGRSAALGPEDYPQICLGPIPNLYPFIVNNPGEGTQAKRRIQATIIDHLTPPLTRAGLYEDLEMMERLLEEHAHALTLYPQRAAELEQEIETLLNQVPWRNEISGSEKNLEAIGNFLCEIKESRIRSGLHILGHPPEGEKEIDLILSLLRSSLPSSESLLQALNKKNADLTTRTSSEGDQLELQARHWLKDILQGKKSQKESEALQRLRVFVEQTIIPKIKQCSDEILHLLHGLEGKWIPPGPAGAPTRGRLDVLPTGRNFFAIDPRILPTPTAWRCGKKLADLLLERHRQETGEYPRTLALVIWGTSNMRTGGDDIAQALWLWGCEPVWDENSGRVIDFRILPANLLARPRVDITLRISGLFRDVFGDLVRLLATVPKRLALLNEEAELNPVRAAYLNDIELFVGKGLSKKEAEKVACLRVFGSAPGCYGTGLLPLLDSGNWNSQKDITDVFCKWGDHTYDSQGNAKQQNDLLRLQLGRMEAVHQNQDNREHDILDSDDYFQFQGGLSAAIETLRGTKPAVYHGDSSTPDIPHIRTLQEELNRVLRSRVFNPRWLAAMRAHGYKGAFEMVATVDYVFGYGATTNLIQNQHYEEMARKLLLAPEQKQFFMRSNPSSLKEACEKMLEAVERGLWKQPETQTIQELENTLAEIRGCLE